MKIILDLLVVVVILLSVLIGVKKGFIKTVIGLIGIFAVLMLTWHLSAPFGKYIDAKLINPSIRSSAANAIAESIGVELQDGDKKAQLEAFEDEIYEYSANSEEGLPPIIGITEEDMEQLPNEKEGFLDSVFSLIDKASLSVSKVVAAIILLIGLSIAKYLLGFLIAPLLRMLRIKKLDSVLGGALGAVRGIVILILLGFILRVSAPLVSEKLPPSEINSTLVFKYAYQIAGGDNV